MFKIESNLRSTLLLGAATAAAFSLSSAAYAQENVETIIVTGSRIPQQGIISSSPVTAVSQQEMKFEGTTNVENLLNNLPATVADYTEQASNGATGQATVNLRGLGSSRTLVLVDGKRLMPSDPSNPVADLNQIPAALVDHVEVLTGGASAVYGSDALAGVVNFVMRKDFEGIEIDGQLGINQAGNGNKTYEGYQNTAHFAAAPHDWWGGRTNDVTMLFGANTPDGKGNVTGYIGYRSIQAVTQDKRDYSACSIAVNSHDVHGCSGSSNYNRWFSLDDYYAGTNYDFFQTGTGHAGTGQFVNYTGTTSQKYNYGAKNYIQRPDVRYIGGFEGHYEVDKALDVYADFMFSDDHTLAQIAPSGLFLGTGRIVNPNGPSDAHPSYVEVNCNNPLMTAQENAALCSNAGSTQVGGVWMGESNMVPGQALVQIGRRDIEGGDRVDDLRHTAYRFVLGAKGDLGNSWNYDISGQYGITLYSETYDNEFSVQRVQNALQVNPATGHCVAYDMGIDTNCVPLDIFNGFGSITPNMLNYVTGQGFKTGYTEEVVVTGSINGDLGQYGFKSPWASDGVGVAFGAEYRKETLELKTSRDFQLNDLYGQGGATLPVPASSFNVAEGFGEVQIPIAQNKEFFQDLSFNGGLRYSAYSSSGDTWAYKAGLQWQPIDDFRFRGSYERAVRAPDVLELYDPANVVLFGGTDPCYHATDPTIIANCALEGAHPTSSCPAAQCNQQGQGNLALKPEESDTFSVGLVVTPTFLSGFTATVDYFDIKVNDYINSPNPNVTLAACYGVGATTASQTVACPLVQRSNGGHGNIYGAGFVGAQTVNTGYLSTDGVDVEANYQSDLSDFGLGDNGSLALNFVATYTNTLITQPFKGFTTYDCAGLFGTTCGTPTPKWRHRLRVTWASPWDVDVSLAWRHLSSSKLDLNTANPILNASCGSSGLPCPDLADAHLAAFDYFDLAATWTVSKGIALRAGVNNLFDKNPPVVDSANYGVSGAPFGNGNTYPGVYDALGRTIFLGVTAKY